MALVSVYRVVGRTGNFDRAQEWDVTPAFTNERNAEKLAANLNAWCRQHGLHENVPLDKLATVEPPEADRAFRCEYLGTYYRVVPIYVDMENTAMPTTSTLETPEALAERVLDVDLGTVETLLDNIVSVVAGAVRARDQQVSAKCLELAKAADREAQAQTDYRTTSTDLEYAEKRARIARCEGQAVAFRGVASLLLKESTMSNKRNVKDTLVKEQEAAVKEETAKKAKRQGRAKAARMRKVRKERTGK